MKHDTKINFSLTSLSPLALYLYISLTLITSSPSLFLIHSLRYSSPSLSLHYSLSLSISRIHFWIAAGYCLALSHDETSSPSGRHLNEARSRRKKKMGTACLFPEYRCPKCWLGSLVNVQVWVRLVRTLDVMLHYLTPTQMQVVFKFWRAQKLSSYNLLVGGAGKVFLL